MKKFTKLAVFDFDSTLVDTPLPIEGKILYKQKTGNDWPHAGWWGQPLSLDMQVFDMKPIPNVIRDYKKEISNPDTMVVMVTGRMVKLADLVKDILNKHGLKFHEHHFNRGGSTDVAKKKTFDQILEQNPSIKDVSIYDDRSEHISIFKQWGENQVESGKLDSFKIFHIINGQPTLV